MKIKHESCGCTTIDKDIHYYDSSEGAMILIHNSWDEIKYAR